MYQLKLPIQHSSPDGHQQARHNMVLYQSTKRSTILGYKVLVMC